MIDARRHGWVTHVPFLVVLALAAALRLVVVVAFPPGFVFSDGPTYLNLVDDLSPLTERTSGYGVLLHLLARADRGVWLVVVVQHLLGLTSGALVYAVLRRRSVSGPVAVLASVPVLFDSMELVVEHSVLSDVVFDLLVVAAVAALGWHRRPGPGLVAVAGLLLGLATCVRVVGQPMLVVALLFCLLAVPGLRRKLALAGVLAVAFVAPLAAYAAWYHHDNGVLALSESGGRALYMRTTAFVECDQITVPDYQRRLCPSPPVGERHDPTFYGWHDPDSQHGLTPPTGTTTDEAMHQFALAAIRAQPGDYLRVVARDVAYNFTTVRTDRYEYDTADKWTFDRYLDLTVTDWTGPAYLAHGGVLPSVHQPYADDLVNYGQWVYTSGPLLLVLLATSGLGLLVPRRRTRDGEASSRALIVLSAGLGLGLMVAPDVTAEFVWRYQLPAVLFLPMAAALAWTRLAGAAAEDRRRRCVPERDGAARPVGAAGQVSPERRRLPAPTGRTAG